MDKTAEFMGIEIKEDKVETIEQIKIDEGGYQAEVYLCTAGKLTWLYGRNLTDRPIKKNEWECLQDLLEAGYSQKDWADMLFDDEIDYIICRISIRFKINSMPEEVKNIIVNMAYNMGWSNFNQRKWPKFFKALKHKDWKQAAIEGRDSLWFTQVGQRSVRLMKSLENVKYYIPIGPPA